jgi:protein-glutamine gamma-glutamyltransferase
MADMLVVGIGLAVIVELAHWISLRWEFDDAAAGRTWQLTAIGIGIATVLIWLDGNPYYALPRLITWLPPLLLPMQFVQSYGLRNSIPLVTFSFFAKQRRLRNLRLGLTDTTVPINFGNVYFVTALVASSLGSRANANGWAFLTGLLILTAWGLLHSSRSRALALLPIVMIAGALAVAGEYGILKVEELLSQGRGGVGPEIKAFDPNEASTQIGKRGTVYQSSEIQWRLSPVGKSPIPQLLRTGSYNIYRFSKWENERESETDFIDLDSREVKEGEAYYLLKENADLSAIHSSLPRFKLRGSAAVESPLPLPGDAASIRDFNLDGVQRNTFGTIRLFPKDPVVDGLVLWKGNTNPEKPPIPEEDLRIPLQERVMLKKVASEIGITREAGLEENLARLRLWFLHNFKYTRDLTIHSPRSVVTNPTAMCQFLTTVRSGHCEYFASASTLLLREIGIEARYTTGFAVMERDVKRKEFVIRGTHGHAWCRYWDKNSAVWRDFDTTPPDWLALVKPPDTYAQKLNDMVKRFREDFFIWRNSPSNRLGVTIVMSVLAFGVSGFVIRRLWRSKRRLNNFATFNTYEGPVIKTPLHDLEPQARKHLGPRPTGKPFAEWLLQLQPSLIDQSTLAQAIKLHQRLRFDPLAGHSQEQERLEKLVDQLNRILKRSKRPAR